MSASLGGLLKDYRLQKNISQLEIAFTLGWKDPARLSRIEQGRVDKPPRELIDKICTIMQLKPEEKNNLLLIGNYLPTHEEILAIRKKTDVFINGWPYPAGVRDFSWRVVHSNNKINGFYKIDLNVQKYIENNCPSVIEITFHPDFTLNKTYLRGTKQNTRKEFLLRMLQHFKYYQRTRTKERWYIDLIQRMMSNDLFRELWPQILESPKENLGIVHNFALKKSPNPKKSNGELANYMFILPCLEDPRFEVELYTPADQNTFEYFQNI